MIRPVLLAAAFALATFSDASAQQPAPVQAASPQPSATPATAKARPGDADLRKRLTDEQYRVTCEADTEPPFHNAYWNNHRPGIYVDVISGKPLFSSTDKFDSGTGWPSFTKPIDGDNVVQKTDSSLGMDRTEVKSKDSEAHLGHIFDDGPADKGGMRYCINSASLRFVPVDKLEADGYGKYLPLFAKTASAEKK